MSIGQREARKLVEVCFEHANAGSDAAVGVLTSLLMGMRASEVTDRVVRDLDDEARLVWIEVGKTKRSRRTLEVPAVLRPYLLVLANDRGADEQLITRKPAKCRNKCGRQWLRYWLSLFCEEAKLPNVCVHSLRGLHAIVRGHASAPPAGRHHASHEHASRGRNARESASCAFLAGTNRDRSVPRKAERLSIPLSSGR